MIPHRFQRGSGFTLVEVLVSIALFSAMFVVVAGVIGRASIAHRQAVALQRAVEDGAFVLDRIAKSLRTSTVRAVRDEAIVIYDFSRGRCVRYAFTGDSITEQSLAMTRVRDCDTAAVAGAAATPLVRSNAVRAVHFRATPSAYNATVGRATIAITIAPRGTQPTVLQTTVSLRDYDHSGLL